jgi:uncharacterized protein DUF5670
MSTLLFVLSIILTVGWLLGFFVFSAGSIIHTLLMMAIIAILLRIIHGKKPV